VQGQSELAYIGQTGRNLRERLSDLRRNTLAKDMPFNDPHTAAPSLWAWRDAEGYEYECSAFTSVADAQYRQALECWLLWQHRLETGGSTLCNHGYFHTHYVKSRDRKTGFRGRRLETPGDSIQSTPGLKHSDDGSMGLDWSAWQPLDEFTAPNSPGVYRIAKGAQVIYIGESSSLRSRLNAHARTSWGCERPSKEKLISNWAATKRQSDTAAASGKNRLTHLRYLNNLFKPTRSHAIALHPWCLEAAATP
jgi:hypothetical protein